MSATVWGIGRFSVCWVCGCAVALQAADKAWSGAASANWGTAATWTPVGVPTAEQSVSVSNSATATLTVQNGIAAVAASLAFDNSPAGVNATLTVANGGSLTVTGGITDPGSGTAAIGVQNATPANAATVLTAGSLTANNLDFNSSAGGAQYLTTGFDITLGVQLNVGAVNTDSTYRQTNGTISVANSGYGLTLMEASTKPTSGTATYILDGGTLKADRIGVANGNGNNATVTRYAGTGVLEFNNGTVQNRNNTVNGSTVTFENGKAFESYSGSGTKDMQYNTSRPLTVRLAQGGTHAFNADIATARIIVSPSAQLVDKAGEAGTLLKAGAGDLILTGGGLSATNTWSGDTTVTAGRVQVNYNLIAGAPGSLALNNAFSPASKLILNGGGFDLTGRGNAAASAASSVTLTAGSVAVTVGTTAGLVVGQVVSNAFLPPGTYIRKVTSGTQIELNALSTSTATQTGQTLDFGAANFTSEQTVSNVEILATSTVSVSPAGGSTLLTFHNLTGTGGLTKAGSGLLKLTTTNAAYAGVFAVSAGTLAFAPPSDLTLTNKFSGSGTIRKAGTNLLALVNMTSDFSGAVVIEEGTLQFGGLGPWNVVPNDPKWDQFGGLKSASSYVISSGATLALWNREGMNYGATIANAGTLKMVNGFNVLGALTLSGGVLESGPGIGADYNSFVLHGHVTVTGSAPSEIRSAPGLYTGIHTGFTTISPSNRVFSVADVTSDASADLTVSAVLLNGSHSGAAYGITKTGAGTMVLTATNLYSGATIVSNGTLLASGGITNSDVVVAGGASFGALGTATARVKSLSLESGAIVPWTYDGNNKTAGRIEVTDALSLPAAATLDVSGAGFLYSGQVLFSAGAIEGATNLNGWTINGAPPNTRAVVDGTQVRLLTNRGTLFSVM